MPLSIIGAGFGRTGTVSLKCAIEYLGFGPCFHDALGKTAMKLWYRARSHEQMDWEEDLKGYRATAGFPLCIFYRELAEEYPFAKVILTVREPNAWFDSVRATILSTRPVNGSPPLLKTASLIYWADLFSEVFGARFHDRRAVVAAYERHNIEVQRSIPADRLLVYEVQRGWPPLCDFLGLTVPDRPFPSVNSRPEFLSSLRAREQRYTTPAA